MHAETSFAYRLPRLLGRSASFSLRSVDGSDHIFRQIRRNRCFYEADLLEHLALSPARGIYVDVGANIGNHAVFFGRFLADHVVCVEPNPQLAEVLRANLQRNGVASWNHLAVGAGDRPTSGRLVVPRDHAGNVGAARFAGAGAIEGADCGEIQVRPLDELLEPIERQLSLPIGLMKLDIEGMELPALQGAGRILRTHRPQLVVELATDEALREVEAFLRGFGYRAAGRFCATPTWHFVIPELHREAGRLARVERTAFQALHRGRLRRWSRRLVEKVVEAAQRSSNRGAA